MFPDSIFFWIVIAIIAFYLYQRRSDNKRIETFKAYATQWGYQLSESGGALRASIITSNFLDFATNGARPNFDTSSFQVDHILQGQERGVDVYLFDYRYRPKAGTSSGSQTINYMKGTAVLLESAQLDLPSIKIRPKNALSSALNRFDKTIVPFSDEPTFDKKYNVFAARKASHDPIIAALTLGARAQIASQSRLTIEGDTNRLLFYRAESRLKPDALRPFIDEAVAIFEHIAKPQGWSK